MILNQRLQAIAPSVIRKIVSEASGIPGCISLSIGEPEFDAPSPVIQKISSSLFSGNTHYPPNAGIKPLRHQVAQFINSRFHSHYSVDDTVITIGSSEAIAVSLLAILNPGDEVIVPEPAFLLYRSQIEMFGGICISMDISQNGFNISETQLEALITPNTKAILYASPNNPSGTILSSSSLLALKRAALRHDLFLINDSIYDQLVYSDFFPTLAGDPDLTDRLIYISGMSKAYAMTGLRLGYAAAAGDVIREMIKAHAFLVASVPGCIQEGSLDIFDLSIQDQLVSYRQRRDYLYQELTRIGMDVMLPEGAFYIFPSISKYGLDDITFCRRLMVEGKLALIPSSAFGIDGYVRISYCYSMDILKEGIARLEQFIRTLD